MQAVIFAELKKYAETRLGADAWRPLLREAGVTRPLYAPGQDYPDQEAGAIVGVASRKTGLAPDAVLQDYGEFIAPDLVLGEQGYRGLKRRLLRAGPRFVMESWGVLAAHPPDPPSQ